MKHYDEKHWTAYVLNIVDQEERAEMEKHLYSCDVCMNTYLDKLEDSNIDDTSITPTFTDVVMKNIEKMNTEKRKGSSDKLFRYYIIAASITLILASTGVFDIIGYKTTDLVTRMNSSISRVEIAMFRGWGEGLQDKSKEFIHLLNINIGE